MYKTKADFKFRLQRSCPEILDLLSRRVINFWHTKLNIGWRVCILPGVYFITQELQKSTLCLSWIPSPYSSNAYTKPLETPKILAIILFLLSKLISVFQSYPSYFMKSPFFASCSLETFTSIISFFFILLVIKIKVQWSQSLSPVGSWPRDLHAKASACPVFILYSCRASVSRSRRLCWEGWCQSPGTCSATCSDPALGEEMRPWWEQHQSACGLQGWCFTEAE